MLQERLSNLKKSLTEYAGLVEGMVGKSIRGLLHRDAQLLAEVIGQDEPKANDLEIALDEACTSIIAQNQPAARDLRTILMVLRMNTDLERMGDHSVNIAQSAQFLIERQPVKPLIDTPRLAETVIGMFRDAINAFIAMDSGLAKSVCERDNKADDLKDKITTELSGIMQHDPAAIERSLHLIRIVGNLERIADLSTNICEDVIFMNEGRVIKHHRDEKEREK